MLNLRSIFIGKRTDIARSIFDGAYYVRYCGETVDEADAWRHFEEEGSKKLLSPSPLFSPYWYAAQIGAQEASTLALLEHYADHWAAHSPHPLFTTYEPSKKARRAGLTPLHDYIQNSRKRGEWVRTSQFFDPDFYLRTNHDVAKSGMDPIVHYLTFGWKEGRQPFPYFQPAWYLAQNPDVAAAGVEPLSHFVTAGGREGRRPHCLIDLDYYLAGAPDVAAAGADPLRHFIAFGDKEGRSPHQLFVPSFYQANGPSIGDAAPFAHFAEVGIRVGRSPCPAFDPAHYRAMYPQDGEDPLTQFLQSRPGERPHTHPLIDGNYQAMTSFNVARGANPLMDYMQFRSHFGPTTLHRGATGIPRPSRAKARRSVARWDDRRPAPKVSIVIPCYNSVLQELDECVASILRQTYQTWELILVDDGSPDAVTWPALVRHAERDSRITAFRMKKNGGISAATNAGVKRATGEFLCFVDHDDVLTTDALTVMMDAMLRDGADAAYSDQCFISAEGKIQESSLKPAWSPALFAGVMYVGHLLIVRSSVAVAAGLFLPQFDGCQDFEFMLRVSEKTTRITHVPQVLYYWRRSRNSVASNSNAKGSIESKQQEAVTLHFKRIGFNARCVVNPRVPHRLSIKPAVRPLAIDLDLVAGRGADLESMRAAAVKSGAVVKSAGFVDWRDSPESRVLRGNAAWVLFVGPGIEFLQPDWLAYLHMYAQQQDVAFVAPHLLDRSNRIVAAGLVADRGKGLLPAYIGYAAGDDGAWGTLISDREVSAVGGECALVARAKLTAMGGLSAAMVGCGGAVREASLRASSQGYRNVAIATPLVRVGDASAGAHLEDAIDRQTMNDLLASSPHVRDRYYNPGFAPGRADFVPG